MDHDSSSLYSTTTTDSGIGSLYFVTPFDDIAFAVAIGICHAIFDNNSSQWYYLLPICVNTNEMRVSIFDGDASCTDQNSLINTTTITSDDLGGLKGSGIIGDFNCHPNGNNIMTELMFQQGSCSASESYQLALALDVCTQARYGNNTISAYFDCVDSADGQHVSLYRFSDSQCTNLLPFDFNTDLAFIDVCQFWRNDMYITVE